VMEDGDIKPVVHPAGFIPPKSIQSRPMLHFSCAMDVDGPEYRTIDVMMHVDGLVCEECSSEDIMHYDIYDGITTALCTPCKEDS